MRLFAAIDLPDAARPAVAAEQERLRAVLGGAALKWVRPEQLHVTLVFIGEVAETAATALVEAMRQPIRRPPFTLTFGGAGVFPERGAPRVLWLGVIEGAPDAVALQGEVAARLEPFGVAREGRPFSPHLTLARWREARPYHRRRLPQSKVAAIAAVPVAAVTLFQSQLSSTGSMYTAVAEAPLQP